MDIKRFRGYEKPVYWNTDPSNSPKKAGQKKKLRRDFIVGEKKLEGGPEGGGWREGWGVLQGKKQLPGNFLLK